MSEIFVYICTKTTADPFLPPRSASVDVLSRDVSDAFLALSGGRFTVGQLAFYPQQRTVPNYLLCDGREVFQESFPELYAFLGASEGVATDPLKFKLPDYSAGLVPATAPTTETTVEGTTSSPVPVSPPPAYDPNSSTPLYGPADSGGRPRRLFNELPE